MKSSLLMLHLLGLSVALGPVLILDFIMIRLVSGRPVRREDVVLAVRLSGFIRWGLRLLWLSGFGLLVHYWLAEPELLSNPKLIAKLGVFAALMANGALVERFAIPLLAQNEGRGVFSGLNAVQQITALGVAAISTVSWIALLSFGAIRELNFSLSAGSLLALYGMLVAIGIALATILRLALYCPRKSGISPSDVIRVR